MLLHHVRTIRLVNRFRCFPGAGKKRGVLFACPRRQAKTKEFGYAGIPVRQSQN